MKIAQFIGSMDSGGAENVVLDLAEGLTNKGHDSFIICRPSSWIIEEARRRQIRVFELPSDLNKDWSSILHTPNYISNLKRLLQILEVEVLHSHLFKASVWNAFPARLAGVRHVATQHDSYTTNEKPIRRHYLRGIQLLGTTITSVSRSIAYDLKISNVSVISNGIKPMDTGVLGIDSRNAICRELEIPIDEFIIVYAGRLVSVKQPDLLIYTLNNIHKHNKSVSLIVLGDGPEMELLERLVNLFKLNDKVKLLGHIDDVYKYLAASNLFLLPSKSEGMSCSIMEAQMAGLPVVAFNVGGNSELVSDNCGKLVHLQSTVVDNIISLELAVNNIIKSNIDELKSMSKVARTKSADYSIYNMVEKYVRLYEKIKQRDD